MIIFKFLVFSIVLCTFFSITMAEELIPDYKMQANLFMMEENYQKAYDIIKKNIPKGEKDLEALYMMGECAENMKKYEEALSLYNTIIKEDSRAIKPKLKITRIYLVIYGNKDKARQEVNDILASDPSPEVKELALSILKSIDNAPVKKEEKPWALGISLGYMYMDNVNSGPDKDIMDTNSTDGAIRVKKKSGSNGLNLGVTASYNFTLSQTALIQPVLGIYSTSYTEEHDSDSINAFFNLNSSFALGNISLGIPLTVSKLIQKQADDDNEKVYKYKEDAYGIGVKLDMAITESSVASAGINYSYKDKLDIKDTANIIGVNISGDLGNPEDKYGKMTIRYATESNRDITTSDNDLVGVRVDGLLNIPNVCMVSTGIDYSMKNYKKELVDIKREDKNLTLDLNVMKSFEAANVDLMCGYQLILNDSNIEDYKYTTNTMRLQINYNF